MQTVSLKVKSDLELIEVDDLEPLQGELKKLTDENFNKLRQSILDKGFKLVLHVWKNAGVNYLIDGHQRAHVLKQLKKQGIDVPKIPCAIIEAENYSQAKETVLLAVSQYGKIDKDGFEEFISGEDFNLDDFDFPDFDFEMDIESESKDGLIDDDATPETEQNEYNVSKGDVWILGEHRIMCGDSTNEDDVADLMQGEKADMVFTDPPYGMFLDTDSTKMSNINKYKYDNSKTKEENKYLQKLNKRNLEKKYDLVKGDHNDFNPKFITSILSFDCDEVFLWGADYYAELLPDKNKGSWLVWDKRVTENFDKVMGSSFELCWSKNKHKRNIIRSLWCGTYGFQKGSDGERRVHPTQKPIKLIEYFFEKWGKEKDLIIDLFLGSGSTLIACEKTGRLCYGMEIDEHYCSVIIKRWEDFTGKKAKKV